MSSHPFGLSDSPFAAGHDARLIFHHPKRDEAVTLLRRRIAEGALFLTVTGESGCGKTSVVTEALESGDLKTRVAFIAHPSLTPSELLEAVCIEFGAPLPNPPSKPQTLASLEHHLRDLHRDGCKAVLVLDEAHGLKTELLEEARLLSNMKHEGRGLLQTVLVGLPELERRLGLPELAQLRQRIALHCRMQPLSPEETEGFVQHRVQSVGGDGPALFPGTTCEEIHGYTNGIPRDIITLAGGALEHAEREGSATVAPEHVKMAAGDAHPGITTIQRGSSGASFELKRKTISPRPVIEAPRAPERSGDREPPPEPKRKPPSFLRTQQVARTSNSPAALQGASAQEAKPTLEERFRSGEVTADQLSVERPDARDSSGAPDLTIFASEHVQELGASVMLVGLLIIVLVVTGRWNPVPPSRESAGPARDVQSATAIGRSTVPETAGTAPLMAEFDSGTRATPDPSLGPETPVAERWADGARQSYGFEVAASSVPDSATALLRLITRSTKLPCQIVTKTSGDRYRVVVGPFPSRRDAQKAIAELFKTTLVKRAQLVQIPE